MYHTPKSRAFGGLYVHDYEAEDEAGGGGSIRVTREAPPNLKLTEAVLNDLKPRGMRIQR
ncbi:Hypothetical protein FKW44_021898 [Caligus rogercresseyi]|uniref:Uncharacterized protein n=1 Tax=Caligus rogercresseyi TaxID=217165 RepID=A0A7T8GSI3_CALRO|nr:Hypothetical protein FKW44_021898 [Caligus rogercresseyi]